MSLTLPTEPHPVDLVAWRAGIEAKRRENARRRDGDATLNDVRHRPHTYQATTRRLADRDEMVRLYVEEEMTVAQVAERTGMALSTVQLALSLAGVTRTPAQAAALRARKRRAS